MFNSYLNHINNNINMICYVHNLFTRNNRINRKMNMYSESVKKCDYSSLLKPRVKMTLYRYRHDLATNTIEEFIAGEKEYHIISYNLLSQFLNKYWQETIFLSLSTWKVDHYINELKNRNISIYKGNDHKDFLGRFNTSLINNQVFVDFRSSNSIFDKIEPIKPRLYIRYVWPKKIKSFISFNRPSNKKKKYPLDIFYKKLKRLDINELPLFTLINGKNQLIMAESSEIMLFQQNLKNIFQKSIYSLNRVKPVYSIYTGLFFVDSNDALEYKNYIQNNYVKSSRDNRIRSFISSISIYYQILCNHFGTKTQFKLVPDLKEVSKLVYVYQYYKNIVFHSDQKYNYNFFQGQPVYIIKPIVVKHKIKKYSKLIKYDFNANITDTVFLNYKTVLMAWNKYIKQNPDYYFPRDPNILVYNLEDFINDYILNNDNFSKQKLVIVPSMDNYFFIKNKLTNKSYNFNENLYNNFLSIKSLLYKIVWSLSRRQPTNW